MKPIINFDDVSYSYPETGGQAAGKLAVSNLKISIMEGEFLAVMGEDGAGKSTFCKLINGIIPQHSGGCLTGYITVDGMRTDEASVPQLALKAGMVFDDPDSQLFTSTVRHEAAFGPENLLLPPEEIEERLEWALAAVGLSGFEQRLPSTLSGGEKQRLVIAAALAMRGKILVLDEPLSRLDPQGAEEVMSVLKEIREKFNITVIMTAHNSRVVNKYADRVCILKNGTLIAVDTAKKIFANRALLERNGIQPPVDIDINSVFSESTRLENARIENTRIENTSIAIPSVEFKSVLFFYDSNNPIIENFDLRIEDNDFIAIAGHNGCGKTSVLKIISGLLRPAFGDIFINGKNTSELSVSGISKEAGFVMQNPDNQLFTDSVFNEVAFALKNAGFPKTEIQQRVQDALTLVGLEKHSAFPHTLSKADRTRLVIACVIAMGCKIIIFDEVDVGQDYKGSLNIMNIAKELHSQGYTIIFVSHNMSLICDNARRLIIIDKKGIVFDKRRPNNEN
ncbi:MAG: ATP-binding cassette domain-containing protein [Treponema sp.]|jgi:energy-coupling factor transport system ATP-binding protein|nr:ATP-binding cassette domain-containing protein [Treponema sp.]